MCERSNRLAKALRGVVVQPARAAMACALVIAAAGCAGLKGSDGMTTKDEMTRAEDLNGARGKIFHVDLQQQRFELLKETVFDPTTHEGRSRHEVYWTDRTRFVKVSTQNGFVGVDGPVLVHIRGLDDANAEAAAEGQPFVVMQVLVPAQGEDTAGLVTDSHNLLVRFTPDPESPKQWGGMVELAGRQVPMRLRGPRAQVTIRRPAAAADMAEGLWETRLGGQRTEDGRFVAASVDLHRLVDPRTTDDPALPRVLVVGDSISMNYHEAAKAELAGIANYHRIEGNGGPSDRGVACMELWLGDYTQPGLHWDLIQFNHGLHDLKQVYDVETGTFGAYQVPIEAYKENLEREIMIMKRTGATLMWCSTTPVPESRHGTWATGTFARRKDEDLVFNQAAMEVISRHPEILVNDLNTFIRESAAFDVWREQSDVHFWGGAEQQVVGKHVAGAIRRALGR